MLAAAEPRELRDDDSNSYLDNLATEKFLESRKEAEVLCREKEIVGMNICITDGEQYLMDNDVAL
jgi:hypothetical protein